ncbi:MULTISPECIES: tetratricopeptide repeat protein [unclassified Lentimicrobium]|uniref:tetratricopeptide repeat protein n=1 Tax=unclassified Lentimicrobium TaxID=2677434 RepID=UPI001553281A|nr:MULTISPECIES: tetratricopeptide repeat protein [unclassified Lentimicrobium]NPD46118.1 tetratricopeptide repeat protein [Lentimicrobium sp. S6]NPD86468.1 tetratricopeptide repeat protein [Lentimicrobium sp. L6]
MKLRFTISLFVILLTNVLSANSFQPNKDSILKVYQGSNNDSISVYALVELSRVYSSSDIERCILYAEEAVDVAIHSAKEPLNAYAMFNAGNAYFYQGMYETATNYFYKYLDIQIKNNNKPGKAYAYSNIGAIRIKMEDFDVAKQSFVKALKILQELSLESDKVEYKLQMPNILNNLGIVHQNLQDYDSALWYYRKGLSLARFSTEEQYFKASAYNNIGGLFLDSGNADSAYLPIKKAIEIRENLGDLYGQAASHNRLAHYFQRKENHEKARFHLYRGWDLAKEIGSIDLQNTLSENIYLYYDELLKPDSALVYYKIHNQLKEVINNTETLKQLTRLELTIKFKEKEKLAHIEQERLNSIYLFTAFILVLLLLVFILLYFFLNNRVRRLNLEKHNMALTAKNSNLEKENLKKELEIRNKELTTHVMSIIRKNELIGQIVQLLSGKMNSDNESYLHQIIKDLNDIQDESIWNEFEIRYQQVYNEFYEKLQEVSPNLSINERRLCAFLRLNMTTKDIVSITGQSQRSVEVARTRLRKKLQITNSDISLIEFLTSL